MVERRGACDQNARTRRSEAIPTRAGSSLRPSFAMPDRSRSEAMTMNSGTPKLR